MPKCTHFACMTPLRYVSKIGWTRVGPPPLTKSWIRYWWLQTVWVKLICIFVEQNSQPWCCWVVNSPPCSGENLCEMARRYVVKISTNFHKLFTYSPNILLPRGEISMTRCSKGRFTMTSSSALRIYVTSWQCAEIQFKPNICFRVKFL